MVARSYEHAKGLDDTNNNTKWKYSTNLKMSRLDGYDAFTNHGIGKAVVPHGYKRIRNHLIYDIKNDGRHKLRCVEDGHLTDITVDSIYSGVLSLRRLRIMLLLIEVKKLEICAIAIGNAYP